MHRPFYMTSTGFFSPEQCQAIINDARQHAEAEAGGIYGTPEDKPIDNIDNTDTSNVDESVRKCMVYTMDWFVHDAVYAHMWKHMQLANRVWNLDISHFSDGQVIEYTQGNYFKPHVDQNFAMNTLAMERKLSVTIQLNKRDEFEGGNLTINGEKVDMDIGDMVVFPSILVHEVEEITGGTRYAFVGWVDGAPWR